MQVLYRYIEVSLDLRQGFHSNNCPFFTLQELSKSPALFPAWWALYRPAALPPSEPTVKRPATTFHPPTVGRGAGAPSAGTSLDDGAAFRLASQSGAAYARTAAGLCAIPGSCVKREWPC